jgi:hypothetical protein
MKSNTSEGVAVREGPWRGWFRTCLRSVRALVACDRPWVFAGLALGVYVAIAARHEGGLRPSPFPFFTYLADAFLHGQTSLRLEPPSAHDLSVVDGRLYLYWSPFPAVLMLPFVALWGVGFSDVLFTAVMGALNVGLVSALLRSATAKRLVRLSRLQRGILVLFFAFGTVHLTLAPFGRVWFTGQLVGFACVTLAYWAAIQLKGPRAFVLTGLALTGALLTRNHLVATGLWPLFHLMKTHRVTDSGLIRQWPYRQVALWALPLVGGMAFLAWYNWVRFGSPLENGLRFHQMGVEFVADYARYGAFHPHYIPTNLYYQYLFYPLPMSAETYQGGGLFWLSPVFLAAGFAGVRRRSRGDAVGLGLSIVLTTVPILLLMGTGYVQFGPRYTLDFTTPLLMLAAMGLRSWRLRWLVGAASVSLFHYGYGALHFMRHL